MTTRLRQLWTRAALTAAVLLCAVPAYAQDAKPDAPEQLAAPALDTTAPSSPGLSLNLGTTESIDRIGAINVPRLDLPVEAVGSTLFKLDLSDATCLSTGGCERRGNTQPLGLNLSRAITAREGDGIDLVLRPRANFSYDRAGSSRALVGAVVEIGEDLREGDLSANTWYLFAGADAEALTYSPDSLSRFNSGQFHLQDKIIVGDAQAGVGYRIGDADVSVSYLRREASSEGVSFVEDAAALSFTWKR